MLRLISWNVDWKSKRTASERARAIVTYKPDIVALQEVRQHEVSGFEGVLAPALDGNQAQLLLGERAPGLLIAARWPMERLPDVQFTIPADETHLHRDPPSHGTVDVRMLSVVVRRSEHPFELHTVHVPPGSTRGWRKIDALRGIRERLAVRSDMPRIVCGDFNEPRSETAGGIETWAGRNRWSKQDPERWSAAVEGVLLGLASHDLSDAFRRIHREAIQEEWSVRIRGGDHRRYDHVLASGGLDVQTAEYLHELDASPFSDHTPALVTFAG